MNTRMRRNLLIKTFALTVGLAGVSAAIYFATRSLAAGSAQSGEEPTFFKQFVVDGGPIVWFVLLPLSLMTAYLATEHFLTIRRPKLLPDGTVADIIAMIRQSGLARLQTRLAGRNDLVGGAVAKAVGGAGADWFRMRNLLAESLQDQAAKLLRRIEWLNLIGNVSPMVGLFGTVYGMIKLFNAIVLAGGQPQTIQLAEGISVALVTTFWGLSIAIPALAIHGVFQNRIEELVNDAVSRAESVMPHIRRALEKQKLAQAGKIARKTQPIREFPARAAPAVDQVLPSS